MLTEDGVRLAIKSIKLYSYLGFYPIELRSDGLPTATLPQGRSKAWRYLLGTSSLLYTVFLAARLGRALENKNEVDRATTSMYAVPLHATILAGGVAGNVTYVLLWRSSTAWLNICLLRDLLSDLPQANGRKWDNTIIRLAPLFYPMMVLWLEIAKWAALNTPAYSLRSVMPPWSIITAPEHVLCVFIEVILLLYWISVGFYALFLQLLFFQRCHDDLTNWIKSLRGKEHVTTYIICKHFGQLRKLQLRVLFFNRVGSMIAYSLKLLCVCECIIGMFFCIKLMRNHPFIGIVSGASGGMMWCCYTALYNRGFELPWTVQLCQKELLCRSRRLPERSRMVIMRQIRSLGAVEVSMGGFHSLERSSTILFLDFVLTKICTLIITFPGQL